MGYYDNNDVAGAGRSRRRYDDVAGASRRHRRNDDVAGADDRRRRYDDDVAGVNRRKNRDDDVAGVDRRRRKRDDDVAGAFDDNFKVQVKAFIEGEEFCRAVRRCLINDLLNAAEDEDNGKKCCRRR
jgi:hypothetical protein